MFPKTIKRTSLKRNFENLGATHHEINFESTCLNSEILVSNGEVEDRFDAPQAKNNSRVDDFLQQILGRLNLQLPLGQIMDCRQIKRDLCSSTL